MTDRRYSDAEISEIFKRATKTPVRSPPPLPTNEGLSLAELQQIGQEVGIPADAVALAARSMDHAPTATTERLLGVEVAVGESEALDRRLSDAEWNLLVVAARDTFAARGRLRADGEFREWTNGNLMMLLEPTRTGHRLRLQTRNAMARVRLMVGTGLVAFSGILTGISFTLPAEARDSARGVGVLMLAVGGLLLGLGLFQLAGWARRRREQMQRLMAQARAMVGATEANHHAEQGESTEPT